MKLKDIYLQKKEQDYYSILEVPQEATKVQIRSARRKLISKYHPDKHKGDDKATAEKISSLINNSFEALNDDDFRDKYDSSNMTIQYSVSDTPVRITRAKKVVNNKNKGLTLIAIAEVSKEVLLHGGEIDVAPRGIPGREIDLTPRTVTISPNTKIESFLVYKGLGEKVTDGDDGDLLVMVRTKEKMSRNEKTLLSITPSIPLISFQDVETGEQELKVDGVFNATIKVNKETTQDSLLFIREVKELNSPLLIKY